MTAGPVLVVKEGSTAKLVLNRPEKKNALNRDMLHSLAASLQAAIADDNIRSVVLTGQGKCFSSGRDIKEFGTTVGLEDASLDQATESFLQTLTLLQQSPKPTIAAVKGFALGGGQALTLACDFVVAERGAQFGNVEMAYGFPAAMNIVLLCQHLGRRLGLEIAMTGELYPAERYWQMGLINRLADSGQLDRQTQAFVDVLNARAPWAVHRTKEAFRMAEQTTAQGGLYLGNQLNQLLRLASQSRVVHSQSDDVKSALKATMQQDDGEQA
jgi:enoyl-CoA hydratase/carnithine racemase